MTRATKTTVKKGQAVAWKTSQGETRGHVEASLTRPTSIKGYRVKASPAQPKLLVRSDRTGEKAAHLASSLRPLGRTPAPRRAR